MDKKKIKFLTDKANFIRGEVIRVALKNQAGHIASSLSCVDILTALYYQCMSYDESNPQAEGRDRLILSKGHGCYGLYAILTDKHIIPAEEWESFYKEESSLAGCIEKNTGYGIEASCGSLGHGLPMAVGCSLAAKLKNQKYCTFCLLGDGELQEGTTWESLQFAVKHEIKNLIIIIDFNRLQAMDFIKNILDKKDNDLIRRLRGFGLSPLVVNGHKLTELVNAVNKAKLSSKKTIKVIAAKTVKGYGLKCMENIPKFHFRLPTDEELARGKRHE